MIVSFLFKYSATGDMKGASDSTYNSGAILLKLDNDIKDGEFKDKALLFTAKMNCTVTITVYATGSNKAWVLTCDDVEIQKGSVNKNDGAPTTIEFTFESGKTYRFAATNGGIRFEGFSAISVQ